MKKKELILKVTDQLQLMILQPEDVKIQYVDWLNDSSIMGMTEQVHAIHTVESTKKYVSECYNNPLIYFFGIFHKNNHIGNIKIGPINSNHATADIAYVIGDKEYWGQGIATKVIESVLKFGFDRLGLWKISAGVYENNIGSIKALTKNNMNIEGEFIEEVSYEGKRLNSYRLGVLKKDFYQE